MSLLRSATYFPVGDVERSAAYYKRVFGFQTEYLGGSPPEFAIVSRDGFGIMLRRVAKPALIQPVEKQGGTWDAFFWVDDVRGLHAELTERGAVIVYGLTLREYQMEEFAVRDEDGHVLGFGQAPSTGKQG